MYKIISLKIVPLLFILVFLIPGCKPNNIENPIHMGNLYNIGYATQDDSNIYYADLNKRLLYRSTFDGQNKTVIYEGEAMYLNCLNNTIYFVNPSDNYTIYQMDHDGNNVKKIYDESVSFLMVYNNKLYFIKDYTYLMSMDEKDQTNIIFEDEKIINVCFYNGFIYYISQTNEKNKLCKVSKEGTNKEIIISEGVFKFFIYNNYIYYLEYSDICRADMNGKNKIKLTKNINTYKNSLNLYNGNLYYSDLNDNSLHSINLETNENDIILYHNSDIILYCLDNNLLCYQNMQLFIVDKQNKTLKEF